MRVLQICPYMHASAGGPPVVVEKLSTHLHDMGWEASVVTTSLYCDDDGSTLQKRFARQFETKVLPIDGLRMLRRARGAAEVIDKAVQQADVVHIHTLWSPLNRLARKACSRHRRKYALMPHGMLDPYSLMQKQWRKKLYLAAIERRNIQEASRLVFTTQDEQKAARQSLPWLATGAVIPLGADGPPHVSPEALIAKFTGLFPETMGRPYLLFLGRIHKKKGLDYLLNILPEIARAYPDILLVVAGSGEPAYVARMAQLVEAKGLERHVLFTGLLSGEAKFGAIAGARAFLLPSRQENFALAMAEAMHMAVPVIISDKVNAWPFVKSANAGYVIGQDDMERGFTQAITEVLRDPAMGEGLGRRGRAVAQEHFTWQRMSRDMVSLYEGMLTE